MIFVYFIAKSSTHRMNVRLRVSWVHRPGVNSDDVKWCLCRSEVSLSYAMRPAWGSPYMPLEIRMYVLLCREFVCRL